MGIFGAVVVKGKKGWKVQIFFISSNPDPTFEVNVGTVHTNHKDSIYIQTTSNQGRSSKKAFYIANFVLLFENFQKSTLKPYEYSN